jgi:hypothetical protein
MATTYNFPDHIKGDTYDGTQFTITVNSVALDLTGASIKMALKLEKDQATADLELTTTDGGITISNPPTSGIFSVAKQIIDVAVGKYFYDIQITLQDETVKTYISGRWKITQDITGN